MDGRPVSAITFPLALVPSALCTTMTEEVTDIQNFARVPCRGPSNFTEWHFPTRLRLDMGAAGAPVNADAGLTWFFTT